MNYSTLKLLIITFEVGLLIIVLGIFVFKDKNDPRYAPIVVLPAGRVKGIVQETDPGVQVYLYQGIRFGRAGRFQKPIPIESWPGVYHATHPRNNCPLIDFDNPDSRFKGYLTHNYDEDCLFLNVWRPISDGKIRAVMVYIYGGGFTTGSIFKKSHDARYIATRGDVIVVSMNYRLGPFGFFYSGNDMPGNQGLYDQILALEWVQKNIAYFGGDPTKVTIFGNSAGSNSVGALLLSPLTKGLFRRAILQSGVQMHSLNFNDAEKLTIQFADQVNCSTNDTIKSIIQCIRRQPVDQLLEASQRMGNPFNPIFGDQVMPLSTKEALNTGKFYSNIDLMFGIVNDEGPGMTYFQFAELRQNETLTIDMAKEMVLQLFANKSYATQAAELYTKDLDEPNQDELRKVVGNAFGDANIGCPVILFGEQFARINPKNHYYSWRLMQTAGKHVMGACIQDWMGVCHADELFYLFMIPEQKTESEKKLSKDMIQAWTQFATNATIAPIDGNVQWKTAFADNRFQTRFMALDSNNYRMVDGMYIKTCDSFWRTKIFV